MLEPSSSSAATAEYVASAHQPLELTAPDMFRFSSPISDTLEPPVSSNAAMDKPLSDIGSDDRMSISEGETPEPESRSKGGSAASSTSTANPGHRHSGSDSEVEKLLKMQTDFSDMLASPVSQISSRVSLTPPARYQSGHSDTATGSQHGRPRNETTMRPDEGPRLCSERQESSDGSPRASKREITKQAFRQNLFSLIPNHRLPSGLHFGRQTQGTRASSHSSQHAEPPQHSPGATAPPESRTAPISSNACSRESSWNPEALLRSLPKEAGQDEFASPAPPASPSLDRSPSEPIPGLPFVQSPRRDILPPQGEAATAAPDPTREFYSPIPGLALVPSERDSSSFQEGDANEHVSPGPAPLDPQPEAHAENSDDVAANAASQAASKEAFATDRHAEHNHDQIWLRSLRQVQLRQTPSVASTASSRAVIDLTMEEDSEVEAEQQRHSSKSASRTVCIIEDSEDEDLEISRISPDARRQFLLRYFQMHRICRSLYPTDVCPSREKGTLAN